MLRRWFGRQDSEATSNEKSTSPPTPPTPKPPPHVVFATFEFNDADCKAKFLEIARGENGLVKTRVSQGCRVIKCFESNASDNLLVLYQEWDCQADHEAYFARREEEGMIAALAEMMPGPIDVRRFSCVDA